MTRPSDARERLLASGMRLIHARSYRDVSVDEICAAAAVNKGSFYYYFPSKRDLAVAGIERQWTRIRATLLEPAFARDLPPLQRIVRLFTMAAALHAARAETDGRVFGCAFGNLALELSTQEPVVLEKLQQVFAGYGDYFAAAIAEACAAGEIPVQDAATAGRALLAFFEGALLLAKTANDAAIIAGFGPQAIKLLGPVAPAARERALTPAAAPAYGQRTGEAR